MSSFLEIGEIVEAIPNPVKVINIPKVSPGPTVVPNMSSVGPTVDSGGNGWGWILLIAAVAGGALFYYNTKKNENISTRNES